MLKDTVDIDTAKLSMHAKLGEQLIFVDSAKLYTWLVICWYARSNWIQWRDDLEIYSGIKITYSASFYI